MAEPSPSRKKSTAPKRREAVPPRKRIRIGKYGILRQLGAGGMGTVYLCYDPDLDRQVAVKLLNTEKADKAGRDEAEFRLRFLREAFTTAQLQHPAIPPVYAVSLPDEEFVYYVMKPIDGRSLEAILDDLRAGEEKAVEEYDLFRLVEVLRDVSQALQYAHSKGLIHRDLKPANIFVGDYGEVYIIDWGLTKKVGVEGEGETFVEMEPGYAGPGPGAGRPGGDTVALAAAGGDTVILSEAQARGDTTTWTTGDERALDVHSTLTAAGDILGTLPYMPPEQAASRGAEVGTRTDVYALGVILYEILTLELPVQGETLEEILQAKLAGEIIPPERRRPERNVPPELSNIAMQAMNPNPDERFKSAAEFNRSLEFWLEGKSQFRNSFKNTLDAGDFLYLPRSSRGCWQIGRENVLSRRAKEAGDKYLLIDREFAGDVRFSVNLILQPLDDQQESVSEFAIVFGGQISEPWNGFVDGYVIHLGASGNTRAYLSKNDSEVVSNEYLVLEPLRQYRLTIERIGHDLRVLLDRHLILFYRDSGPPPGFRIGFINRGEGVEFSNLRVMTRGLPTMTASIDVPEALMSEGCYRGAFQRYIAIAHGHKDRAEGAWARYRAGLASYRLDSDPQKALRVWAPLKKGPYSFYEKLGRAKLELERGHEQRAAAVIGEILDGDTPVAMLDPVAELIFTEVQQRLRQGDKNPAGWRGIDLWARLALRLGPHLESRKPLMPNILWRWLLTALTRFPQRLPDCILFLRESFGKGQGAFAEVLTTIEPLMNILRRSAAMSDHAYLVGKVMRLILFHDDRLGNLETLARFYLHAGHEEVARKISRRIVQLCLQHSYDIPPMPITFLALTEWLTGDRNRARVFFAYMVERSVSWAKLDGKIFLGLDNFAIGLEDRAARYWRDVLVDPDSRPHNRHLIARGLLGELPADPVSAGVPHRTDHRLLYSLFLGYKHFLDWERRGDETSHQIAVQLLESVLDLIRPSYDIYSATDVLARVPLEKLGRPAPPKPAPPTLTPAEENWVKELSAAAAEGTLGVSGGRPGTKAGSTIEAPSPPPGGKQTEILD